MTASTGRRGSENRSLVDSWISFGKGSEYYAVSRVSAVCLGCIAHLGVEQNIHWAIMSVALARVPTISSFYTWLNSLWTSLGIACKKRIMAYSRSSTRREFNHISSIRNDFDTHAEGSLPLRRAWRSSRQKSTIFISHYLGCWDGNAVEANPAQIESPFRWLSQYGSRILEWTVVGRLL